MITEEQAQWNLYNQILQQQQNQNPLQNFFNWYHQNGILPNLWKGMTGQLSAEQTAAAANQANVINTQLTNQTNKDIARETNETNAQIAQETNAQNKEVADMNYEQQERLFEYNKALQEEMFKREDTSYQRTVEDMKKAGLSPLGMSSVNGAGQLVSQSAPQSNYQAKGFNAIGSTMQAPTMQQAQTMSPASAISVISSIFEGVNQAKTGKLERDGIALANDERRLNNLKAMLSLGAEKTKDGYKISDNSRYKKILDNELKQMESNSNKINYESKNTQREYEHKVEAGKYDSDNQYEQILTMLEDWILGDRGLSVVEKAKNSKVVKNISDVGSALISTTERPKNKLSQKVWNFFDEKERKLYDWADRMDKKLQPKIQKLRKKYGKN